MTDAPEERIREVAEMCADCESCRDMMETCPFFPELYRLWDRQQESGAPIPDRDLRRLADLCNYCGLCSCPDVREKIIAAKTGFVERDGLSPALRLLEDVARVGRICGAFPRLSNLAAKHPALSRWIKKAAGIHEARTLPSFPDAPFFSWAAAKGLTRPRNEREERVLFFAGCTGAYLFPRVPEAASAVLEKSGVEVWVPEQGCCGMPSLLEGDRDKTIAFVRRNLTFLADAVTEGRRIVTACPTCGYMLKEVLPRGAWYSDAYQKQVGGDDKILLVPDKTRPGPGESQRFRKVRRDMFKPGAAEDGYFSPLDPIRRITVSENTFDLGEYLLGLLHRQRLNTDFGPVRMRAAYYPPCHLREQNIGRPYLDLLRLVPGLRVEAVEGVYDCCGMAGIMGFKKTFHDTSLAMGRPLMAKIDSVRPERIITDCLSCRLQFEQMADYPVVHPVEVLDAAYRGADL